MNEDLEMIFNQIIGNQTFHPYNRDFLMGKIQHYKMLGENPFNLHLETFILENWDTFEIWCNKKNITALYQDLKFQVKNINM